MTAHTVKDWEDSLIWCPSQCYYYFYVVSGVKKMYFMIYLRWRHQDPWTGRLVMTNKHGVDIDDKEWNLESANDFSESCSLSELKNAVIIESLKIIKKL